MQGLQTLNRYHLGKACWIIQLEFQWRNLCRAKCILGWDFQVKEQKAVDKWHHQFGCLGSSIIKQWATMADSILLEFLIESSRQNRAFFSYMSLFFPVKAFSSYGINHRKLGWGSLPSHYLTLHFTLCLFRCSLSHPVKVWGGEIHPRLGVLESISYKYILSEATKEGQSHLQRQLICGIFLAHMLFSDWICSSSCVHGVMML